MKYFSIVIPRQLVVCICFVIIIINNCFSKKQPNVTVLKQWPMLGAHDAATTYLPEGLINRWAKKTNTAAESPEKVRYSEHYRYSNCRYPNLRNFRSTERNNSKQPIPVVVDTWVVAIGVLGLAAAAYVLSNEPGPGRPSHRIMAPRETSFEILLTSLTKLA